MANLLSKYQKILSTTRASDWRFSFIPHIFGNLYLWIIILDIPFSISAILLLSLSLTTSFGFAALGYFINEFFDKKEDFKAGKINKLAVLSAKKQVGLFTLIVLMTFLPWLYIPWNEVSLILIGAQIALFLLYAMPWVRFKRIPILSGITDAGYAYVVPMLLSFYSFALFSGELNHVFFISVYAILLLVVGFRNITIHHINDIFKDKRIGFISLPRILGVKKTDILLKVILVLELMILLFWLVLLVQINLFFMSLIFPLVYVLFEGVKSFKEVEDNLIVNNEVRHTTDIFYQFWLPIFTLLILIFSNFWWLFILPLHTFLFIPKDKLKTAFDWIMHIWFDYIRPVLSFIINYTIYFMFLIFTVDLIKENKSAWQYLTYRFGNKKQDKKIIDDHSKRIP